MNIESWVDGKDSTMSIYSWYGAWNIFQTFKMNKWMGKYSNIIWLLAIHTLVYDTDIENSGN